MLIARPLQSDNINTVGPLLAPMYQDFFSTAKDKYHWDLEPIEFTALCNAIQHQVVRGYWIEDTGEDEPLGLMLYTLEPHQAIEINLLLIPEERDWKSAIDVLMRRFLVDIQALPGWNTVSFAMLGIQNRFIRTMPWYGFKPIGQTVLKLSVSDPIAVQLFMQYPLEPLPESYRLSSWEPSYGGDTSLAVHAAFSNASDALWDPRFRTESGCRQVVSMMTSHQMGKFYPEATSLLLKNDRVVGFCFCVETNAVQGNIPLIGILPEEKGNRYGHHLLKRTVHRSLEDFMAEKNSLMSITATTDTENFPALHMYRHLGFDEGNHYPHVYLTPDTLKSSFVAKTLAKQLN
ncbi:MAG: GNAT family N-acetyltransferase [Cyanobacteria bacterium]|nr:GNAT family N-acetyltransferase [Cyanobacteriota bacterium]